MTLVTAELQLSRAALSLKIAKCEELQLPQPRCSWNRETDVLQFWRLLRVVADGNRAMLSIDLDLAATAVPPG